MTPDPINLKVDSVRGLLRSVSTRKACGPDKIPGWVLKSCYWELTEPVSILFNRSYHECVVPKMWKTAEIVPVPKVKVCTKLKDFRPTGISKTSILGKLLQKPVKCKLQEKVGDKIDPLQFGFAPGKSTVDALIHLWHFITSNLDNRKSMAVFVFLMDVSSAFDSVKHDAFAKSLIELHAPKSLAKMVAFLCS